MYHFLDWLSMESLPLIQGLHMHRGEMLPGSREKSVFCTLTKGNFYSQNSAYRIGKLKNTNYNILCSWNGTTIIEEQYKVYPQMKDICDKGSWWTMQSRCHLEWESFVAQPKEVKKLIWNLQRSWASISNCITMRFGTFLPQFFMKNPSLPLMLTRIAS